MLSLVSRLSSLVFRLSSFIFRLSSFVSRQKKWRAIRLSTPNTQSRVIYFAVQGAACLHSLALGHEALALGHSFTFGQSAALGQVAHSVGQGFSLFWHSAAFGHDAQSAAGQAVSAGCTHSVQALSGQACASPFCFGWLQQAIIATDARAITANDKIFFIIVNVLRLNINCSTQI